MITSKMNEAENHASEERFSRHRNTAVIEMDVKTTISSFFLCASKVLEHQDKHARISLEIVNPAAKCCLNFRTHVFHFRGLLLKRWAES